MVYTLRGKEAKKFLKKMKQKEKSPISKDEIALAKEIAKIPYKNKPKDYPFHNKKRIVSDKEKLLKSIEILKKAFLYHPSNYYALCRMKRMIENGKIKDTDNNLIIIRKVRTNYATM